MNFEAIYTLLSAIILVLLFIFNVKIRNSMIKVFKSLLNPFIITTLTIFICVFLIMNHLSIKIFNTSFLSPLFYLISFITYILSFDNLIINKKLNYNSILNYVISIFKISVFSFFLDILFTMSLDIHIMLLLAAVFIILFAIINFTNKNDFSEEIVKGYEAFICISKSLLFYIPFIIITYFFNIIPIYMPLFILSIFSSIFMDLISPICSNRLNKILFSIKIFYIIASLSIIPFKILLTNFIIPTLAGNIAIIIASGISLIIIVIQTKFYRYKQKRSG